MQLTRPNGTNYEFGSVAVDSSRRESNKAGNLIFVLSRVTCDPRESRFSPLIRKSGNRRLLESRMWEKEVAAR